MTPQQPAEFQQGYDNDTPSPFALGNTDPSNGLLSGSSSSIYSRVFHPTVPGHTAYFQTLKDTVSNIVTAGRVKCYCVQADSTLSIVDVKVLTADGLGADLLFRV